MFCILHGQYFVMVCDDQSKAMQKNRFSHDAALNYDENLSKKHKNTIIAFKHEPKIPKNEIFLTMVYMYLFINK